MKLYHYYHIYCDEAGEWQRIVAAHLSALQESGLADELIQLNIGIVGDWNQHDDVYSFVMSHWDHLDKLWLLAQAQKGYEQVTINAMRANADLLDEGFALYAHTKGSAYAGDFKDRWRNAMTDTCVGDWLHTVTEMIIGGFDTAGCYFIDEFMYEPGVPVFAGVHSVSTLMNQLSEEGATFEMGDGPEEPQPILKRVHYSGNFWWSTLDWLRKLQYPCPENTRWDAEMYVGKSADGSFPLALNLREGNPFEVLR